uniref:Uncharacterized protein n=1 Tax=Anguilla anguilla TaxID=7936 RepID=A0A0E9WL19_ANGAN
MQVRKTTFPCVISLLLTRSISVLLSHEHFHPSINPLSVPAYPGQGRWSLFPACIGQRQEYTLDTHHSFTPMGNCLSLINLPLDCGRSKPTWQEHTNSTQKGPGKEPTTFLL